MNVNGINNVNFGMKAPVSRIKIVKAFDKTGLPADNEYLKQMVESNGREIEQLANFVGRDVILAQRGNLVLVNSGLKTDAIDLNRMNNGKELIEEIKSNLKKNDSISRGNGINMLNN